MSKFKVLALAATFVLATAGLAIAGGDCASKASAETASASGCSSAATAETAAAKTASAEGCASSAAAQTASAGACASKGAAAQTASAEGCASTAAAKTASAEGCTSGAAAETAAAKTASAEGACSSSASTAAVKTAGAEGACASKSAVKTAGADGACSSEAGVSAKTVQIETVRMPSGSMAVFYSGTNAETVAYLQSKAEAGCAGFVCDMAKGMAADENVATEIAATEHGVMILVTAKSDASSVDKYEEQYAAVVASMDDEQGE